MTTAVACSAAFPTMGMRTKMPYAMEHGTSYDCRRLGRRIEEEGGYVRMPHVS